MSNIIFFIIGFVIGIVVTFAFFYIFFSKFVLKTNSLAKMTKDFGIDLDFFDGDSIDEK